METKGFVVQSATGTESRGRDNAGVNIKVCMLCDLYLPYFSGAAIQAHRLAGTLARRNVSPFVLAVRHPGTVSEEIIDDIPVKRVEVINTKLPLVRPLSLALNILPDLFRYRNDFDILHIHSVSMFGFLPIFLARLLGKKTIIKMTLLGSPNDPATWSTSRVGRLMRLSFLLADRVVSISAPLSENYQGSGLDVTKLRQLPQGVDISRFHPVTEVERITVRGKLGLRRDAMYLCFVGSFKYRKGADILVDAFIAVAENHPELHLLVVGPDAFDDPLRVKLPYAAFASKLKEQIKRVGLAERVVFTGRVDNVEAYLQASDVFVFPSRREGFPTSVIEAMAVGLPCVLANLNGISAEISAQGKTALIVDTESPLQYAEQISGLLASPSEARRMGKRARQRVEKEYAMDIVAAKYIDLYRELLDS